MLALYKKEMRTYFTTPLGYVFLGVFLAVSGFVFAMSTYYSQTSDVSSYFQTMILGYVVIIPILTMRGFAEERRARTEQLLLTSPITISGMVFAKFFAAFTMFAGSVLVSCLYYIPLFDYGTPNVGKAVGSLIAMLLIGMCFIAVGLFVSTLTESTVTACIGTMGTLLVLSATSIFNNIIDSYFIRKVLSWVSVYSRFDNFIYGEFDIAATVYYISITAIFLFLSVRIYEGRRYA